MKRNIVYLPILWLLTVSSAYSVIHFSGIQNIMIPTDFDGIYLDIETGNTATSDSLANWDINFIFGGEGIGTNSGFNPIKTGVNPTDPIRNLSFGTEIDANSEFYGGEFTGSSTHMGNGVEQFESGTPGYIGFLFVSDLTGETMVGSMHVTLYNDGTPGTIHHWAWEDEADSIIVGAIPEPARASLFVAMLALLVLAVVRLRRRNVSKPS